MKKQLLTIITLAVLSVGSISANDAKAQFTNGSVFLGPEIALPGYGSGGIAVGAFLEFPVTHPGSVGPGLLGVAFRVDYWGWSNGFYSYSFIPFAAILDYHFVLEDRRFDPFIGLGLGYDVVNVSYSGEGPVNSGYASGIFVLAQIGARYFFSPNFAGRAELGFGGSYLGIGVDFRL